MLKAASGSIKKKWPAVRDYAESEFRKFLLQSDHIKKLKAEGKINQDEARFLMNLQANAMKAVLLTVEGLGMLAVEAAVNAAIDSIKDVINIAIGDGWKIL